MILITVLIHMVEQLKKIKYSSNGTKIKLIFQYLKQTLNFQNQNSSIS